MNARPILIGILAIAFCVSMPGAQTGDQTDAVISGVCLDSDGKPLGFSRVSLFDARNDEIRSVVAAGDGTFSFNGICPGSYFLRFSRLGMAEAWYGGDEKMPVYAGTANVSVSFAFPRGQTLSGIYADPDGSPLGRCDVGLLDANMRLVAAVTTSANGSFSFIGVTPGRYYLRFSRPGAPDVWYGGRIASAVQVGDAPVSIAFTHPGGLRIAGTCAEPCGKPLGFSRVSLFDQAENEVSSVVAAGNGSFAFTGLAPGSYYLKFSRAGTPDAWYGDGARRAIVLGEEPVVEVRIQSR